MPELKLSDSPTLSGDSSRSFSLALHMGWTFRGKWTHEARRVIAYIPHTYAEQGRADERTRTADLLITSVRSVVAGRCTRLQMSHK